MQTFDSFLSHKSQLWIICAGVLLASLLAVADVASGADVSVLLLYFVPICMVTWYVGTAAGSLLTVACSSIWFYEAFASQPLDSLVTPIVNHVVRLVIFLLIVQIIGKFRATLAREQMLARTDSLTTALNWRAFEEVAGKEIERSRRHQRPITVAYLDLNDFKHINDRFGHSTGDNVLKDTVLVARRTLRINDTIARLGGDEFVVLLPETDVDAAYVVLSRIQQHLTDAMQQHGWPVTCSIGAVSYRSSPAALAEILRAADYVMYTAKQRTERHLVVLDADAVRGVDGDMLVHTMPSDVCRQAAPAAAPPALAAVVQTTQFE